ncbi:DUF1657 domain-containing protein [Clostridium lundense]|uniref:DUF1657 domain-containing protein n=1 Tax=Clostridium lundense TaxID=319475 RepID=UPI00048673E7|nr:DUF1657 domain-containing protein [Clostridium lundense]
MTVESKVKQTLANLKGVESTLRIYSLQSKNKEEVNAYKEALNTTESVIKDIEDRIKTLEFEEPQYKED